VPPFEGLKGGAPAFFMGALRFDSRDPVAKTEKVDYIKWAVDSRHGNMFLNFN
jgi:hypothetical protein